MALFYKFSLSSSTSAQTKPDKFAYARPSFLQLLTHDELKASADHEVRPIIVPRDINLLPFGTGYAECINSGKSEWNEDQGAFCRQVLSDPTQIHPDLPYTYFGMFDGHAGYGAALAASNQFHHILHEKLVDCIDMLLPRDDAAEVNGPSKEFAYPFHKPVSKDDLVIGALEGAFHHMDTLIEQDRDRYGDAGGCTACVALFINGKMFVANAGDSRAVLCLRKSNATTRSDNTSDQRLTTDSKEDPHPPDETYHIPFSFDHTPETERQRLISIAIAQPFLLRNKFSVMEYAEPLRIQDLGKRVLCRQGIMKGWMLKTLRRDDFRRPVVTGEGKRSRLLGTLGVTRGFGDHGLMALDPVLANIHIKPFLTPHPDVNVRDLSKIVSIPDENNEDGDYGMLVIATDGLWDVSDNDAVSRTVFETLSKYPRERHRYTMVAQELVARARGKFQSVCNTRRWCMADSRKSATIDDVSVFAIPVYQYYREHVEWEKRCTQQLYKSVPPATEAKEDEDGAETKMDVALAHPPISPQP